MRMIEVASERDFMYSRTFERVEARHDDITNYEINDLLFKYSECAHTVVRLIYLITFLAQQVGDELSSAKFIFNHKDCFWHRRPCRTLSPQTYSMFDSVVESSGSRAKGLLI